MNMILTNVTSQNNFSVLQIFNICYLNVISVVIEAESLGLYIQSMYRLLKLILPLGHDWNASFLHPHPSELGSSDCLCHIRSDWHISWVNLMSVRLDNDINNGPGMSCCDTVQSASTSVILPSVSAEKYQCQTWVWVVGLFLLSSFLHFRIYYFHIFHQESWVQWLLTGQWGCDLCSGQTINVWL